MIHPPPILFDRLRLRKRRVRAAPQFAQHDFLQRDVAVRIAESLAFIARPLPLIVELGSHTGALSRELAIRPGTMHVIACDPTYAALQHQTRLRVVADEEWLPFAANSVDAVVSSLALHWVNDLPGTLAQIHRILKPDGLFMAVLPGGETLRELRAVFAATESARSGGVSPRVAPFIDIRDAGALLQRAQFALPVADSDIVTITYPHLFALMDDLRCNAQSNMLHARVRHFTPRGFFTDAATRYYDQFRDQENRITATVELITITAWKPAASQQQPAKRGSGKMSLTTFFE